MYTFRVRYPTGEYHDVEADDVVLALNQFNLAQRRNITRVTRLGVVERPQSYRATFCNTPDAVFEATNFSAASKYVVESYRDRQCTGLALEPAQPAPSGWASVDTSSDDTTVVQPIFRFRSGNGILRHYKADTVGDAAQRMLKDHPGVHVEGVDANLRDGKGWRVLTPHMGSWVLPAQTSAEQLQKFGEAVQTGDAVACDQCAEPVKTECCVAVVKSLLGVELYGPFNSMDEARAFIDKLPMQAEAHYVNTPPTGD
jgi:hypothetical protein